ncbi:MAG: hypothetical protein FJ125_15855, partial [Deltaproteobacteria bacterium]|nr:hypothetical protein [Deltaproteobacteria bacterium]
MVTTKRPFRPPRLAAFSVLPASLLLAVAPLSAQTPPSAGCIHAASLPIRICGASEEEQPRAAGLLALAERCWQAAVGALGLTEPWRLDTQGAPEPGLSLEFVDDPLQPAAELQPLADVPGTPHADCATRLALGRGFPVDLQQRQLVYELLRAMQAADDCAERQQELVPHYLALLLQERLGLAGEGGSAEYVAWLNDHFLGIFQANPDFSLDFTTPSMTELDLYPVGQTLFAMYLDQRWGSGDGRLLARALHAGRQEGSVIVRGRRVDLAAGQANEPDLYDALDLVLAEQGGSFWQAVAEFGVWRFFCGAFADGDHLRHAGLIRGAAVAAMHGLDQLPLQEQLSPREPQETGSVYIDLELAGLPGEANEEQLLFELRSDGGEAWYLAALVFDGAGGHRLVEGGAQEGGTARLVAGGLAGMQHVVFLVTCLGDQLHDPDERDWATVPFRYSLRRISVPRVDQVQPARLRQGEQDVALLVRGAGFVPGIAAQLGPGIAVKELLLERTGS